MMTLAKWMNAVGPDNLSTDSIVAEMKAFKGPLILGSPVLQCGKYPKAPGVCNDFTQFYKYDGDEQVGARRRLRRSARRVGRIAVPSLPDHPPRG